MPIKEVEEGNEPEEFWELFPNGKTAYGNADYLQVPREDPDAEDPHPPRLFKCSETTGKFVVRK